MTGEIAGLLSGFLHAHPGGPDDPVRKLAVFGVPAVKRRWWNWRWGIEWPPTARFFETQEEAKAWLVHEG